jgi:hypothetical protein
VVLDLDLEILRLLRKLFGKSLEFEELINISTDEMSIIGQ